MVPIFGLLMNASHLISSHNSRTANLFHLHHVSHLHSLGRFSLSKWRVAIFFCLRIVPDIKGINRRHVCNVVSEEVMAISPCVAIGHFPGLDIGSLFQKRHPREQRCHRNFGTSCGRNSWITAVHSTRRIKMAGHH